MIIDSSKDSNRRGRELASSSGSVSFILAIVKFHEFVGTVYDGIKPAFQGNVQPTYQCSEAIIETESFINFRENSNLFY
jgi:hypothetical protein